jgi:hypothetical protein
MAEPAGGVAGWVLFIIDPFYPAHNDVLMTSSVLSSEF